MSVQYLVTRLGQLDYVSDRTNIGRGQPQKCLRFSLSIPPLILPRKSISSLSLPIRITSARVSCLVFLKGTVSVISSDPRCKDGKPRFTTVPSGLKKALSDQV